MLSFSSVVFACCLASLRATRDHRCYGSLGTWPAVSPIISVCLSWAYCALCLPTPASTRWSGTARCLPLSLTHTHKRICSGIRDRQCHLSAEQAKKPQTAWTNPHMPGHTGKDPETQHQNATLWTRNSQLTLTWDCYRYSGFKSLQFQKFDNFPKLFWYWWNLAKDYPVDVIAWPPN